MKQKLFFLLSFFFFSGVYSFAQIDSTISLERTTEIYAIKESDTLRLDLYQPSAMSDKNPCVIFMFGGGFVGGSRDRADYIPFFNHLLQKGYAVVSIDYRLGLKKVGEQMKLQAKIAKEKGEELKKPGKTDFLYTFAGVIDMAVEDLFSATTFICNNADKWNIDKDNIIACGSSAGAISVLHGEYNICNHTEITKALPDDFRYAGIISFAGAIFSVNGDLKWENAPAPVQFFHGDADKNVPYDQLRVKILGIPLKYGFFGSKHIVKQLGEMKVPYYFYSVENANHSIADSPMQKNRNEVDTFLDKFVKQKQKLIINSNIQQLDKPNVNKKFGISDYLQANGLGANNKK